MSAHTPGPWLQERTVVRRATPDADSGAQPVLVCVAGEGTSSEEDEANARLIAAAPDLLEACRYVAYEPCVNGDSTPCDMGPDAPSVPCSVCCCRSAIAKAEGR